MSEDIPGPATPASTPGPAAPPRVVAYEVAHAMPGRLRLRIPRLAHDRGFARRLVSAVEMMPRVERARVNALATSLVVSYRTLPATDAGTSAPADADQMTLARVVECVRVAAGANFTRELMLPATAPSVYASDSRPSAGGGGTPAANPPEINVVQRLGLPVLGIGLSASALAGLAIPGLVIGGVVLASALPIYRRTMQGIRDEGRLPVDLLDASAIVLMTAQGIFLAPAIVVTIIEASEIVRDWTARRSEHATLALAMSQDRQVPIERDGQPRQVSWERIQAGDVLHVYPGDQIPTDGVVLDGAGQVDQHRITGDMLPVARAEGDEVLASTFIVDGQLRLRATRSGQATHMANLMALAQAAPARDTRVSNHARRLGNWAVVPTLATGAAVWATSGSVASAASIVSLDLGTGMRVSAPIAIVSTQAQAARQGILIRHGRGLEALARVDTVVFDKTGILTSGQIRVVDIRPLSPRTSPDDVLRLAASTEQALGHPVARAIVRAAQARAIGPRPCATWQYVVGQGVVADIDGRTVHVGSRRLLALAGIEVDPAHAGAAGAGTHVYVARAGRLIGVITCDDTPRPECAEVIGQLHALRIATWVASGDTRPAALATATGVGIDVHQVHADLLPHQKIELVTRLQAQGATVAVVGDGINDAGAMAHADVSLTLGSAPDLTRATADIVLMNDDLRDLLLSIILARQALHLIEQNQALIVVPNVASFAYGVAAMLSPTTAAAINNGTALVAALNSLRPLHGQRSRAARDGADGVPSSAPLASPRMITA